MSWFNSNKQIFNQNFTSRVSKKTGVKHCEICSSFWTKYWKLSKCPRLLFCRFWRLSVCFKSQKLKTVYDNWRNNSGNTTLQLKPVIVSLESKEYFNIFFHCTNSTFKSYMSELDQRPVLHYFSGKHTKKGRKNVLREICCCKRRQKKKRPQKCAHILKSNWPSHCSELRQWKTTSTDCTVLSTTVVNS